MLFYAVKFLKLHSSWVKNCEKDQDYLLNPPGFAMILMGFWIKVAEKNSGLLCIPLWYLILC